MKGTIEHKLWTLLGYVKIRVTYIIKDRGNGLIQAKIITEGDTEEPPDELRSDEVQEEILDKCIEDMERKGHKLSEEPEENTDQPRFIPLLPWRDDENKWCAN